jgi:hypothetical protein
MSLTSYRTAPPYGCEGVSKALFLIAQHLAITESMPSNQMNWSLFYLFVPLAAAVAVIAACIKFIQWLSTRRKRLIVSVSCHPYVLHPAVAPFLKEQKENVEKTIKEFFERHPNSPAKGRLLDDTYEHAASLGRDVKWKLSADLPYEARSAAGGWFATAKNEGDKKCVGVNLKLPHATFAVIHHDRAAEPTYLGKINENVDLGELRPKGSCSVVAWTGVPLSNWDLQHVHITHDAGTGVVSATWHTDRLSFALGNAAKHGLAIFLIAIATAIILSLMLAIAVMMSGASVSTKTPSASPTATSASPSP